MAKENLGVKITARIKKNPWMILSIFLAAAVVFLVIFPFPGLITGMAISEVKAGELMGDYLNSKVGGGVSVVEVAEEGDLYQVTVSYKGQQIPVYMTKDGEYFIQGAEKISITGDVISETGGSQVQAQVPKSSKPIVELFVMTYCPYGLQAEKGIIPILKILGNDIDGNIRFVHYFMHGDKEEQETYRQVCIREEQPEKFISYLECFANDGDSAGCLAKAGIDSAKLSSCIDGGNAKKYYAEDSELSKGYGVQGSPALIINGAESGAGRNPSSYLEGVCIAFTDSSKPSECSQQLSSANPSPGFGSEVGTAATGSATCG